MNFTEPFIDGGNYYVGGSVSLSCTIDNPALTIGCPIGQKFYKGGKDGYLFVSGTGFEDWKQSNGVPPSIVDNNIILSNPSTSGVDLILVANNTVVTSVLKTLKYKVRAVISSGGNVYFPLTVDGYCNYLRCYSTGSVYETRGGIVFGPDADFVDTITDVITETNNNTTTYTVTQTSNITGQQRTASNTYYYSPPSNLYGLYFTLDKSAIEVFEVFCSGQGWSNSCTGETSAITYNLIKNGTLTGDTITISEASHTFTIPYAQVDDSGVYSIEVSDTVDTIVSDEVIVTVSEMPTAGYGFEGDYGEFCYKNEDCESDNYVDFVDDIFIQQFREDNNGG